MESCGVQLATVTVSFIVVVLLLQISHVFRYYAKFAYYYAVMFLSGFFTVPLALLLRPKDVRNIGVIAKVWGIVFSVYKIKYDLRNTQRLESRDPFVVVCNHQSELDVIAMMQVLPDRCTVLSKKELFYAGPFGIGAWLCGVIFVDRLNHERAIETMQRTAQMLHDQKLKLWVFPEGTRSHSDTMLPFKKGAFHLAIQAQIPIVPVVMSSYASFWDPKNHIFNPGRIIINCLPPVSTVDLTADDVSSLTERVRDEMIEVFRETSKELPPPLVSH